MASPRPQSLRSFLVMLALILVVGSPLAQGYVLPTSSEGEILRWDDADLPIPFRTSFWTVQGYRSAVAEAADTWNQVVETAFAFDYRGSTFRSPKIHGDGYNVIGWGAVDDPSILAETVFLYYPSTGQVVEADVVFSTDIPWSTGCASWGFDVETVMLHEFGHWLPLDHTASRDTVLYPYLDYGECKRVLSADEESAVQFLYPYEERPAVLEPSGPGTIWAAGEERTLSWLGFPGTNVRIDLCTGGVSYATIVETTFNDGQYLWTVPADLEPAENYRIHISSVEDPSAEDDSDWPFAVVREDFSQWQPLVGDWNGDGAVDVGRYDPETSTFTLYLPLSGAWREDRVIQMGIEGDVPLAGDWDGNSVCDIGIYRPSIRTFSLDVDRDGIGDMSVTYGAVGDIPVTGDWDGDGTADVGTFRPSRLTFYLDANKDGLGEREVTYGAVGDIPVTGDWDGDGTSDVGTFRPSNRIFYLDFDEDGHGERWPRWTSKVEDGDLPLVGDWDGDGVADIGFYRPGTATFVLDTDGDGIGDLTIPLL